MKASVVALSLFSALAFALAAVAEFAGFLLLRALPPSALVGGLAAGCVFALALCDYARKPSFRVRRPSAPATDSALEASQETATAQLDWTYAPAPPDRSSRALSRHASAREPPPKHDPPSGL